MMNSLIINYFITTTYKINYIFIVEAIIEFKSVCKLFSFPEYVNK